MQSILNMLMVLLLTTDCYAKINHRGQGREVEKIISFIAPTFYARLHTKEFGTLEFDSRKDFLNSYYGTPHNLFGPALEMTTGDVKVVEYWYEGRLHHPYGPSVIVYKAESNEIIFTAYHNQGVLKWKKSE